MKHGVLENIVTTGKIEGKRNRGRQCEKIFDSVAWQRNNNFNSLFW